MRIALVLVLYITITLNHCQLGNTGIFQGAFGTLKPLIYEGKIALNPPRAGCTLQALQVEPGSEARTAVNRARQERVIHGIALAGGAAAGCRLSSSPGRRARRVGAMSASDDGELMRAYARSDLRAFEQLYARHRAPLYRYLVRQTRDRELANDLFQETWSRVIASRERYEPRARFQTFLYTLAYNCFIDHCRRCAVRKETREGDAGSFAQTLPGAEQDRPDVHAEWAEARARYRAALERLPQEQRDAFLLHQESGLSVEEIGTITGVGAETAKSRLRYAIAKLRCALEASSAAAPALAPGELRP